MNRLTIRRDHGITMADGYDFGIDPDDYDLVQEILNRLAEYEDTGLSPEQIVALQAENERLNRENFWLTNGVEGDAKKDGRLVVPSVKPGDTVHVDARTLPYNYLHPADGCRDFARCEVLSIVTTGAGTYLKLRAMYPSRAGRRDYLRYSVGAIGKTVFLTREEAEAALERQMEGK